MNLQPVLFIVGILAASLGGFMLIPALYDWFVGDPTWIAFAESSLISLLVGILLWLSNRPEGDMRLSLRDAFLMTVVNWVVLSGLSALPFIFSNATTTLTDSFFEAISGLTTTGASVIVGLDFASGGILLWRAMLQALGGVGIILVALTILPILRIGGMQLFRSEFSDRSEKILPRVSQISKAIFGSYTLLTVVCGVALWIAGMDPFEATCHALTTISTGGMSVWDTSIGHLDNLAVEIIMAVSMILGGSTLVLVVQLLKGQVGAFFKDSQIRTYLSLMVCFLLMLTGWLCLGQGLTLGTAFRQALFNGVSVMTTSGFSTVNYSAWGTFPLMAIFVMFLIGGCTGSTSSGLKIFRIQMMYALTLNQIYKLLRPHRVLVPMFNKQQIPDEVFASVFSFITLFGLTYIVMVLGLSLFDLDFLTALSGAGAALTNLGPGLGEIIGPSGTYAFLPNGAKWLFIFGMIAGRLELVTLLILFTRAFWRDD